MPPRPLPIKLFLGGRFPLLRGPLVPTIRVSPTVTRRGDGGWSFTWPVGRAPYGVWLDGVLLDTVTTESYECLLPYYDDEAPALEIVNADATAQGSSYPPFVQLQWRGLQTAYAYLVEQYVSAAWVTRGEVLETKRGYYSFASQAQTDAAAMQWRVSALDQKGNAGTPLTFSYTIVRNPDPPSIALAITAGSLVVSAA